MTIKFTGSITELQGLMTGVSGDWTDDGNGKHSFRTKNGGVLNWWPSKGTVQLQGTPAGKETLQTVFDQECQQPKATVTASIQQQKRQIFIVHGHDTEARDQLELALHRLGLDPFILMNSSGGGLTIIEALEGQIGRDYSSAFGIVLMTPDDFGYAKKDGPDKAEPRARQNVLLETGMLLSSLTRARMTIIVKGHVEMPSDLQGIIRLGYNDHIREVIPKLCQRLREAGFAIDADKMSAAAQ